MKFVRQSFDLKNRNRTRRFLNIKNSLRDNH